MFSVLGRFTGILTLLFSGLPTAPFFRWIGSTVKGNRTPVLGIEHSGPGHEVTCSSLNPNLRRRLSGPGKILMIIFTNYLQKTLHFSTNFYNKRFHHDLSQTERFPSNYKTLMYAFGWQNSGGWIGSTVSMNGTPVFAIEHPGLGSQVTCTPLNSLLHRRLPFRDFPAAGF